MFARNPEAKPALAAWLAIAAAAVAVAAALDPAALPLVALAALASALPWLVLTAWRYRKIAELAQALDRVLHGERDIDLARMREGELAILSSELSKMIARLTATADDLEAQRSSLADALADISHQIKTPLTSLSITTELLRQELSGDESHPQALARLRRIDELELRIQDLVSTLLKLARLDAGTLVLAHDEVRVADLVERAVSPLAIQLDLAGIALETAIDGGASFTGDIAWSAEALSNVLKNCMEHTPRGGRIVLEAHEDALACRISVIDSGTGIAPEDLPHIFERFYRGRADAPASQVNPKGVGIGLSLARALVTAQGGTITAGNAIDEAGRARGARFDIAFFKTAI